MTQQARSDEQKASVRRGGYVLIDCGGTPECLVIATGSEVDIAAQAVREANSAGRRVRLISMPSTDVFDAQDAAYRDSVLPPAVKLRVAVEAAATQSWWRYVGYEGRVIGIDHFGASAKASDLFPRFGFTADNVGRAIRDLLKA